MLALQRFAFPIILSFISSAFEQGQIRPPRNSNPQSGANFVCPSGSEYNARFKMCLQKYLDLKPWRTARKKCRSHGGDLLTILNEEMNQALYGIYVSYLELMMYNNISYYSLMIKSYQQIEILTL
ncbi:hypothetical protein EGW08_021682 [Elysia chlorotica]|uniref:C-type lectin domain-containing protein n=1 Tax=Elysia chlorotica TaxID=188477 RepID=A0A3S1H1W4_ELYCH|nr:hypothetical protein EGW08_021682 [Elysia chlorotica]